MGGDVLHLNRAKLRHFVGHRLAQIIAVIIGPSACRDEVIFIFGQSHDGVFSAGGALGGQRIGQIDAAHARQFVGGEPIQKCRCTRAFNGVFGERSGIDQTNTLADGACLVHCILPPATATKAASVMIKGIRSIQRTKIIRPLEPVDTAKLRAAHLLPVIGRRRAQGPTRGPLLIGVVQNIDVLIRLFVFPRRVFRGHPTAIALGIQRGHVDLGLTLNHQLCQIIPGAARGGDAKAKALGQPHITQTRGRSHQGVAIWCITDRSVEIILQANGFRGRNAMDHRHVFFFNPLKIKWKKISAKTVRDSEFEPRRRIALVRAQNPTAALFTHIPFGISIPQHRMLGVTLSAPSHKIGIGFGHDELMLDRDGRYFETQKLGRTLRVIASCGHYMFGVDDDLLF